MVKINFYTGFLALAISIYSISDILATERQQRKGTAKYKTMANYPARASPGSRASPEDTTQYSIRMEGQSNDITINGKKMGTTPDTTEKQNNIRVRGEGNTVTINQTDQTSEVNISQQGKNNRIKIIQ